MADVPPNESPARPAAKVSDSFENAAATHNRDLAIILLILNRILMGRLNSSDSGDSTADNTGAFDAFLSALIVANVPGNTLAPATQARIDELRDVANNPANPQRQLPIESFVTRNLDGFTTKGAKELLNSQLCDAMMRDAYIRKKVLFTFDQAQKHGLDPCLLANQIWQESRYRDNAVSPAKCKGAAQFSIATGAQYGLKTPADFFNPWKSIEAAARHMRDMTTQFGDQRLALAAYNGGPGAIMHVQKMLGKKDITVQEWMNYMASERRKFGVGPAHAWRNQSYEYIERISSTFWNSSAISTAKEKMAALNLQVGTATPENSKTIGLSSTFAASRERVVFVHPSQPKGDLPTIAPA